jgi:hypothetical protein
MSERKLIEAAGEIGWRERVVGVTVPLSKTMAYLIFSQKILAQKAPTLAY